MHPLVTAVAEYLIYPAGLVAVLAWLTLPAGDRWRLAVQATAGAVLTLAVVQLANHAYYDPRPFVSGHVRPYFAHPADNGFPSDHTAVIALAGVLLWPYRRVVSVGLLGAAVLVGVTRVVAHVHTPLDIVAALVIAALGGTGGLWLGGLAWTRWRARHAG